MRKKASKYAVFFIVLGTSFFWSPLAEAQQTGPVQITCANSAGAQRTNTVGWDNSNIFFMGKGNIARLYCEGGYAGGDYRIFISTTLTDNNLLYYNGVVPTAEPAPQPTETATATPSPEPSSSPSATVQETQTSTTAPSPSPSESATPTADPSVESGTVQTTESATATESTTVTTGQTDTSSSEVAPSVPTPPPAVEPTPTPVPQDTPQPEPQPTPSPVPQPDPLPVPVSEPVQDVVPPQPEPVDETPLPPEEPAPVVDETTVPESQPEPSPEPEIVPEQTVEPSPVEPQEESQDNLIPESFPLLEPPVDPMVSQEVVQLTQDTDLKSLAPDTPVQLANGVVVTAEVAIAVELLQDPGELLATVLTDPMAALAALSNVGADLPPEVREQAEDVIVSAVIAGNIATQAAASAAAAASYRRKP